MKPYEKTKGRRTKHGVTFCTMCWQSIVGAIMLHIMSLRQKTIVLQQHCLQWCAQCCTIYAHFLQSIHMNLKNIPRLGSCRDLCNRDEDMKCKKAHCRVLRKSFAQLKINFQIIFARHGDVFSCFIFSGIPCFALIRRFSSGTAPWPNTDFTTYHCGARTKTKQKPRDSSFIPLLHSSLGCAWYISTVSISEKNSFCFNFTIN